MSKDKTTIQSKIGWNWLRFFITVGILYIINLVWQLLELWEFGALQPSTTDTFMGIGLALSIYHNIFTEVRHEQ